MTPVDMLEPQMVAGSDGIHEAVHQASRRCVLGCECHKEECKETLLVIRLATCFRPLQRVVSGSF